MVEENEPAMVTLLLTKGAKADAKTHDERVPLLVAAQAGNLNIAEMLLAHGADPNIKTDFRSGLRAGGFRV